MTVRRAQKLDYPSTSRIRRLVDRDSDEPKEYMFFKDAFEYGGHSQLFVGAQRRADTHDKWVPRVFKRVSALPAHAEGGLRHSLAVAKHALAVDAGMSPSRLPWQKQGTMRRKAIHEEIAAVQNCSEPFAQQTAILATHRTGHTKPSKYWFIMPPAAGDLLEAVRALDSAPDAMRRHVAIGVLAQIGGQLRDMHERQYRAHGDVRAENILCVKDSGRTKLLLWDFGLAVSGHHSEQMIATARQDMLDLGRVFAMLLAPDYRGALGDERLNAARLAIGERHPDLKAALDNLLNLDAAERWTASQVRTYLASTPFLEVSAKAPQPFLDDVHSLSGAVEQKWAALVQEAAMVYKFESSDL